MAVAAPGWFSDLLSVVARPWFQDAPVARVAGWTGRTSEKPQFSDPTDRCTLESAWRRTWHFTSKCNKNGYVTCVTV